MKTIFFLNPSHWKAPCLKYGRSGAPFRIFQIVMASVFFAISSPALIVESSRFAAARERIQKDPDLRRKWEHIHEMASAFADPSNPRYADPAKIDLRGAQAGASLKVQGHWVARQLSREVEALGFAAQITGDERFGRLGAELLVAIARKLPVDSEVMRAGFAGVRGDMARTLAIGWDWVGDWLSPEERREVAECGAGYVRAILLEAESGKAFWVPYHNFMGVAGGGAGLLALALANEFPNESPGWIERSRKIVETWLEKAFDEGANLEGTLYGDYGLGNAVQFLDSGSRSGMADWRKWQGLFQKVAEFYAFSKLPAEGVFDARNDANYSGFHTPAMREIAFLLQDGLAKWVWKNSEFSSSIGSFSEIYEILWADELAPVSPGERNLPLSRYFRERGLVIQRSGWDERSLLFSIEAGPYFRVTHNQADKGHFNLYGLGRRWAVDSGYGNTRTPGDRAQSEGHSVVFVDGKGQALSGAGSGTEGRIVAEKDYGWAAYTQADCLPAYRKNSDNMANLPLTAARRHSWFVRPKGKNPGYVILCDDIEQDEREHEFTWQMLVNPEMEIQLQPAGKAWVQPAESDVPRMRVAGWGSGKNLGMKIAQFVPASGAKESYPQLRLTTRANNPYFVVVLLLLPEGTGDPPVIFRRQENRLVVEINLPDRRDILEWDLPKFGEERADNSPVLRQGGRP